MYRKIAETVVGLIQYLPIARQGISRVEVFLLTNRGKPMVEIKYKVFLGDIWFESLYGADYYNDKPIFFAHGARQFFTIYQISRNGDFKKWVGENYNSFKDCLDNFYWDKNPASKLK